MAVPVHPAADHRWRLAIVVLAGALAYLNSLFNPFVFDDVLAIADNGHIRRLWDMAAVLVPERELPVSGRPVVNLSFAINYAIGGLNVVGYHVWNIAVHVLCAPLVFGIARRCLERPACSTLLRAQSCDLAFATALLWVVHPLASESVAYLTQRTESMMAFFYLLTVYAGLRGATEGARWDALAIAACALGMGCKESMATAPVMVVIVDRVFLFDSLGRAFARRWRLYLGLAVTWGILAGLLATSPRPGSAGLASGLSPWTYLLNQPPLLLRYLRLTAWPTSLVANYGWPRELALGDVLPSAVVVVCLAALTLVALFRRPAVGFLGVWCFITLAPSSSLVPIATEVGAERRMYLALPALLALAVVGGALAWDASRTAWNGPGPTGRARTLVGWVALALVTTALAATTAARNREYASGLRLARTVVERYPTPVAHHALAVELLASGDPASRAEAMAHLRQALPGAPRAHFTLGVELFKEGKHDEALVELRRGIREQPQLVNVIPAREYIGNIYALRKQWPEAIGEFTEVLARSPGNVSAERALAEALFAQRAFAAAIAHYRAYLNARGDDVDALNNLGVALRATGKLDDAVLAFGRGVTAAPNHGTVRRNLASALWARGDLEAASRDAREAVRLQPDDARSHAILGRILAQQGQTAEAAAQFERALRLDPTLADAREELRRLPGR